MAPKQKKTSGTTSGTGPAGKGKQTNSKSSNTNSKSNSSVSSNNRADYLFGDEIESHTSRKVAGQARQKRGGIIRMEDRIEAGQISKTTSGAGSKISGSKSGFGDGGARSKGKPAWLGGDVKVKKVDLHKYDDESTAMEAVRECIQKVVSEKNYNGDICGTLAFEIVCGAGTHTQVNTYGRNVKETGDWKGRCPRLFMAVKKLITQYSPTSNTGSASNELQSELTLRYWIDPSSLKSSSIYIGGTSNRSPIDTMPPAPRAPALVAADDYLGGMMPDSDSDADYESDDGDGGDGEDEAF